MNPLPLRACALPVILFLVAGSGCATDAPDESCVGLVCQPCPPALTLRVHAPSGRTLPEVRMGAGQGGCSPSGATALCNVTQQGAGHYELDLQAAGYRSVHHVEEIPAVEARGCCDCGYEGRVVDLTLEPE